ncbi:hypothetical protein MRB53_039618 [Persea americana]|nr:hypothetical protein MRB53_039618 [Persea americana]
MTAGRTLAILKALKRILTPAVAGRAIFQPAVFQETMDILDRLVLTEATEMQTTIVEIAHALCINHPSATGSEHANNKDDNLSDEIDQLFELTRLIVLVIAKHVPGLSEATATESAHVLPAVIKSDLHACILHIFASILSASVCQDAVVPEALPILRRFYHKHCAGTQHNTTTQIRSAVARFHVILDHAQKRESEISLTCEKNCLFGHDHHHHKPPRERDPR